MTEQVYRSRRETRLARMARIERKTGRWAVDELDPAAARTTRSVVADLAQARGRIACLEAELAICRKLLDQEMEVDRAATHRAAIELTRRSGGSANGLLQERAPMPQPQGEQLLDFDMDVLGVICRVIRDAT